MCIMWGGSSSFNLILLQLDFPPPPSDTSLSRNLEVKEMDDFNCSPLKRKKLNTDILKINAKKGSISKSFHELSP